MKATYSLQEVAEGMRLYDDMKDPVRWLTTQILKRRITARRVGRHWRMTQDDIDHALDVFSSQPKPAEIPQIGRPSAGSMRGRIAS
jgi:hypothetical protein